jgi:YD repeat-containing protein
VEYGYDSVGNRQYTRQLTPGLTDRSEIYSYDQRHRLRQLERGTISAGADPVLQAPLADDDLTAVQDWPIAPASPGLDRRGNWNVFTQTVGQTPETTTQTRVPNGANEYETIDPDGSGPLASLNLTHDPAGNLTLDPTARNHDDPPALGNETGQAYEHDEENRLTAIRRASNNELLLEISYDAIGRRLCRMNARRPSRSWTFELVRLSQTQTIPRAKQESPIQKSKNESTTTLARSHIPPTWGGRMWQGRATPQGAATQGRNRRHGVGFVCPCASTFYGG